jgi:hypothetical protein
MSKSLTIWALIAPLAVAGCMTEGQFLASRQPTAMQVAVSRGQFEMNCQRRVYQVFCPMGGDSCTALEGQTS